AGLHRGAGQRRAAHDALGVAARVAGQAAPGLRPAGGPITIQRLGGIVALGAISPHIADVWSEMMEDRDLIPLKEAQEILGVSHTTMARLVREGRFTIYQNPLDRRQKLVHISEVRAAARPIPIAQEHREEEAEEATQRTGPIPIRQPRLPEDDQFKAAFELLRILNEAHKVNSAAPFIH